MPSTARPAQGLTAGGWRERIHHPSLPAGRGQVGAGDRFGHPLLWSPQQVREHLGTHGGVLGAAKSRRARRGSWLRQKHPVPRTLVLTLCRRGASGVASPGRAASLPWGDSATAAWAEPTKAQPVLRTSLQPPGAPGRPPREQHQPPELLWSDPAASTRHTKKEKCVFDWTFLMGLHVCA